MPKIYSQEKRQEIKKRLMDAGLELIKKHGMKKMSIEQLSKAVGIAQGTFYNFFASKEMLVCELANAYTEKAYCKMNELVGAKGYLSREDLRELYFCMLLKDEDNVYRFLKREDIQILITRLPDNHLRKIADSKEIMQRNLQYVKEKKETCDLDAVINWIQVMNVTLENKDVLVEAGVEKIVKQMIENMLDEIF